MSSGCNVDVDGCGCNGGGGGAGSCGGYSNGYDISVSGLTV
jgi:hypothetical protein